MFDVIQRVISGEKVGGDDGDFIQRGENNNGDEMVIDEEYRRTIVPNTAINNNLPAPVLVESDMEHSQGGINDATNANVLNTSSQGVGGGSNHTFASSLSDVSAGGHHYIEGGEKVVGGGEDNGDYTKMIIDSDKLLDRSRAIPEQTAVATFDGDGFPRNDSKVSNDSSCGSLRAGSQNSSRDWGWFEDVHGPEQHHSSSPYLKRKDTTDDKSNKKKGKKGGDNLVVEDEVLHNSSLNNDDAAAMAVTAPNYVLEESLSSQKLWKDTAGCRPPQPVEERAFFEQMWAQNFARSQVEYRMPVEVLTATSPISLSPFADGNFDSVRGSDLANYNLVARGDNRDHSNTQQDAAEATLISRLNDPRSNYFSAKALEPHHYQHTVINKTVKGTGSDGDLKVLVKGDNVFGTTVSKSFARSTEKGGPITGIDTVNISVASYRVVESDKHGKYAQFLVIYREGSIRDTIGVWKRYSDFVELAKMVTQAHEGCAAVIANMSPLSITEEHDTEHLPNAITSWRLLKKRQRWYRCLDAGYLSLKVFLLERFLHDILFESSNPNLLRDFVGTDTSLA